MRELGSCVAPISGEHLISESVIEVLQGEGGFSISGVPWLAKGEEKILSKKSLRANCLCTKHNSSLAPIDEAAKQLFRALKIFLDSDVGEPRHVLVSGHDIERWLLKTAKALAVSGNLVHNEKRLSGAFAKDISLVDMLDDPTAWPEGAGLYCVMNEGDLMVNHSRFQLVPWVETAECRDEIVALQVSILGFIFVLLLEQVDLEKYPLLGRARYRPGRIEIQHPKSVSWVTISWEDNSFHATLKVQHVKHLAADQANGKAR
ncbi:hypothetical protein [Aurantiacibacter flavus]|uniref:Uncharacterized protein n=1 Tax=Aurantiacibacter flavus TaxID=3145232 RepID=A0ABV0CUH7_9SPHN